MIKLISYRRLLNFFDNIKIYKIKKEEKKKRKEGKRKEERC